MRDVDKVKTYSSDDGLKPRPLDKTAVSDLWPGLVKKDRVLAAVEGLRERVKERIAYLEDIQPETRTQESAREQGIIDGKEFIMDIDNFFPVAKKGEGRG
jgi:hypothetical protein